MKQKKSGFTLIELLVTITIIAVLAAIGLMTYTRTLKQGRDSKRQSDLGSIQSVLEQYYADQFYYPTSGSSCSNGPLTFGCALKNPLGSRTYMNTVPSDPTLNPQYAYTVSPSGCDNLSATTLCTSYCVYAKLESTSTLNLGSCAANGSYNYAVSIP